MSGAEEKETIMKLKMATVLNVALGVLSLAIVFISAWVGGINSTVSSHDRDIATLKECARNQTATLVRIESVVEDIRNDQVRREKKELR